jgi:hypothetical protein
MVEQLKDPVFWELFWNNGGRFLLTLLVIDILLLIACKQGIKYGNFKNRRNRSTISGSNRRWINQTTKRRRLFDGMEVLETNPQRLSARFNLQGARPTNTSTSVQFNGGDEPIRSDRVILYPEGTIQQLQRSENELPESTEREESLPHSLSKVLVR